MSAPRHTLLRERGYDGHVDAWTPGISLSIALIFSALHSAGTASAANTPRLDYGRDVRPILSENCFLCHGQDSKKRMAGLRLDSFEGATADRGGRAALVPGKPQASADLPAHHGGTRPVRMPPVSSNRSLTPEQIAILKRWIEEGGQYSKHWAFTPARAAALPDVAAKAWVKAADRRVRAEAPGGRRAAAKPRG